MTSALAISTVAFLLLSSPRGAAARRRRVGSGSSSYCVDDYDQRVLCGNTIASIVGGAISGLFLLVVIYCVGMALWRRHRWRRRVLLPKIAAAEDHPETSTIASGSTFHYTGADPIAEPAPAYMKFQHPDPKQPYQPHVVPVGTYAAPQGPPTV